MVVFDHLWWSAWQTQNPSGCVECVSPSCITQAGLHINTSHQSNDAQCWLWLESVSCKSQFGRSLSCVNAKTGSWEMELLLDFLNRLCDIRVRFSLVRHHIHFTVCPQQPLTGWLCSAALKRLSLFTTLKNLESLLCWPLNTYNLNCVVIARLWECMSLISSLCLSWLAVNITLPDQ